MEGTVWEPEEPGEDREACSSGVCFSSGASRAHPSLWSGDGAEEVGSFSLIQQTVSGGFRLGKISPKRAGLCRRSFPQPKQCCSPRHPPPCAPSFFSNSGSVWSGRGPVCVLGALRSVQVFPTGNRGDRVAAWGNRPVGAGCGVARVRRSRPVWHPPAWASQCGEPSWEMSAVSVLWGLEG